MLSRAGWLLVCGTYHAMDNKMYIFPHELLNGILFVHRVWLCLFVRSPKHMHQELKNQRVRKLTGVNAWVRNTISTWIVVCEWYWELVGFRPYSGRVQSYLDKTCLPCVFGERTDSDGEKGR